MSDSPSGDLHETASVEDASGILAGLPRTRPQRASARRSAARSTKSSGSSARQPQASATSPSQATKRARAKTRASEGRHTGKREETAAFARAPRQGFEAEPDALEPVQPPGSTELLTSAAELAGELAKAGVSAGTRVLRDFLARLPG